MTDLRSNIQAGAPLASVVEPPRTVAEAAFLAIGDGAQVWLAEADAAMWVRKRGR